MMPGLSLSLTSTMILARGGGGGDDPSSVINVLGRFPFTAADGAITGPTDPALQSSVNSADTLVARNGSNVTGTKIASNRLTYNTGAGGSLLFSLASLSANQIVFFDLYRAFNNASQAIYLRTGMLAATGYAVTFGGGTSGSSVVIRRATTNTTLLDTGVSAQWPVPAVGAAVRLYARCWTLPSGNVRIAWGTADGETVLDQLGYIDDTDAANRIVSVGQMGIYIPGAGATFDNVSFCDDTVVDGGDPPTLTAFTGLNANMPIYYENNLMYANLGRYNVWKSGTNENGPAYVNAAGDLIAMRAGQDYNKTIPRTGTGTSYYRITWEGAATFKGVYPNGVTATPAPSGNGPNLYEFSVDWSVLSPEMGSQSCAIVWNNSASANPVVNLDVREIDAFGGSVLYPDEFYPAYLTKLTDMGVSRMRWLGGSYANGISGFVPVNWADRTPDGATTISMGPVAATGSTGTGTSSLAFTAAQSVSGVGASIYGPDAGLLARVSMQLAIGAAGNNVKITLAGSAPTGGVVVSGDDTAISAVVTMFDGETTADQFKALWNTGCVCTGYVSGTTLTITSVTSGRLGIGFGIVSNSNAGSDSYAGLDLRTCIVQQLTATDGDAPGLRGTYEISISGSFGSDSARKDLIAKSLGQNLAAIVSGGAGDVAMFGPLPLSGGADPVCTTGMPIETMVRICNTIGADLHYTFATGVSDDYVAGAAAYCAANLDKKFVVEWSNEVWNFAVTYKPSQLFAVAYGIRSDTPTANLQKHSDPSYGFAKRYREIMAICKTAYAAHPEKLVRTLTCIQHLNTAGTTNLLSSGDRDCSQHTDVISTAPYIYNSIFDAGGKKYKGLLAQTTAYAALDYGYYGSKAYYANTAATLSTADPTDDANFTEMTPDNLLDVFKADIDHQIDLAVAQAAVAAAFTNDRGNPIGYDSYEGGNQSGIATASTTGDGAVVMTAFVKDLLTSNAYKVAESYFWHQYSTRLPGSVMDITNEEHAGYNLGADNWGLDQGTWMPDNLSPRRVAFTSAAQGVFFDA